MLLKQWAKEKEEETFLKKKIEEKLNSVIIMTPVDGKGTVFPANLKLDGESFE